MRPPPEVRPAVAGDEILSVLGTGQYTGEVSSLSGRRTLVRGRMRAAGVVLMLDGASLRQLIQNDSAGDQLLGFGERAIDHRALAPVVPHAHAAWRTRPRREVSELLGSTRLSGVGISFVADNVIQLRYVGVEGRLERGISVLKARGVRHATEARRMSFTPEGIEVGAPFEDLRGVLTGFPVRP